MTWVKRCNFPTATSTCCPGSLTNSVSDTTCEALAPSVRHCPGYSPPRCVTGCGATAESGRASKEAPMTDFASGSLSGTLRIGSRARKGASRRIAIEKQVNILGSNWPQLPGSETKTLGAISLHSRKPLRASLATSYCKRKLALQNLYIHLRLSWNPPRLHPVSTAMESDIDMRDMVAMSILLAGFTPYLTHGLNPDVVYRGT